MNEYICTVWFGCACGGVLDLDGMDCKLWNSMARARMDNCSSSGIDCVMEVADMSTVVIGLCITAMIIGIAVTITQCWYWYERKIAAWHHEMMTEEFARGWDAAIESMKRK